MMLNRWTQIYLGMALALTAISPTHARAADDTAKFEGQWKTTIPYNGQDVTVVSIHTGSTYKNYVILPNGSLAVGDGAFSAVDGKWTAAAAAPNNSGTYQFTDKDTAVCSNAIGQTVTWNRDNTPLPPAINQQAPVPAPNPVPTPVPTPQPDPALPPRTGLATPVGKDLTHQPNQTDAGAVDPASAAAYMDGLEAIKSKQWADAAKSFSQAITGAPIAPHYLAKAIAEMLAGDMDHAGHDFDQAGKLARHDPVTRLWYEGYFRLNNRTESLNTVWGGLYNREPLGGAQSSVEVPGECSILAHDKSSPAALDARGRLEQCAVDFAQNAEAAPELAGAMLNRMNAEFQANKIAETLRDLAPLMQREPTDDGLLQIHAVCLRYLGWLLQAREELTRVLTDDPTRSSAYCERAIVEARLGNLARAKQDLAQATKFDADGAAKMTPLVQKEIAAWATDPAADSPDKLYAALRQAAEAGQTPEQLLPLATDLAHCMNAHRLRWDEGYQDRLRELGEAIRANPRDVAALLAFGEFVFREADIQSEHPGPWSPLRPYRYDGNDQSKRELELADQTFDAVLAIDANNAVAMTWKGAICLQRDQWDDGSAWVNKAYSIRRDLPELLELLSRILNANANSNASDAQDLRSTKTWTDFGPEWDTVWTHEPSQDELNRAAGLQQSANQMWQSALEDLAKAAALKANTADGHYYAGLLAYRKRDLNGAIAEFLQAANIDFSRRNADVLVDALFKAGRLDDAVNTRFKFAQTRQTTAVALLATAYVDIQNGFFDKAQNFVNYAIPIDPADTKIDAYAASIATASGEAQEAIHWYNIALALEEAQANMNGESIWRGTLAPGVEETGMTLLMDLRGAARAVELGQHDVEMAFLNRNLQLEPRVGVMEQIVPAFHTILPNPNNTAMKKPRTALYLFAWTHVMHAYALCAEQRYDDAAVECQTLWTQPHDPSIYSAQQRAIAVVMRLKMSKKDPDAGTRRQWLADIAAERGLKMSEVERMTQVMQLNSTDNYSLRHFATDTMFNLDLEDQSVPDDGAKQAASTPGQDTHAPTGRR